MKKLTRLHDETRSETEIQAEWCGKNLVNVRRCVRLCERHVFEGVRIKDTSTESTGTATGTAGKRARDE